MKKNKLLYFILALILICGKITSQQVEKIKFKKDPSLIYFFQKGPKSDTIHKSLGQLFYLVVPDALKKNLSIEIENGQLLLTSNDSLVKFNYLPGFKYESFYTRKSPVRKAKGTEYEFNTAVDGISILPHNRITISLIDKGTGGLLLQSTFVLH